LCIACCTAREYKLSGDIFIKTGEYEKAIVQYQKWAKREKDNPQAYVSLSVPYYKQNNYKKSAEYLKEAFDIDKDSAEKAVLFYENLLEVKNYSWSIFYNGAKEFLNEKQLEIANGLIEKAEKASDSNYKAMSYVLHGRIYMTKGEDEEAINYLDKALNFDTNNVEGYISLGEIYINQNEIDKAIFNLKKAVSIDHGNFLAHKLLGQNYLKQAKYDMAIETLEKASSMSGDDPLVLYSLSYAYLKKEDYTRASSIAEKILVLPEIKSDAKAEAYILIGISNIHKESYDEAIEALNKALEADSNNCDSYQLLALAYNKAGKVSLSQKFSKEWEKCVQK
jgi:tetratricopeptide (TPR) repeat protein